ncbi:hypothetical protein G6F65_017778 [Rhizopus arrhizus]|nr:hypothetical protein G6F65_017778 [Rhizopus arrhizus]
MTPRVLTGITPSGTPPLGNYVGAIRPALAARRAPGSESFFFPADLHSLIKSQDPQRTQRATLEIAASWLACGLDPEHVWFYRQSDIRETTELMWFLTAIASKGILNRAHAYKAARRPVHVPGADGCRHPDLQGQPGAGGPRPDPAHRNGARLRPALQPRVRQGVLPAAGRGDRRAGGNAGRPRRPQDEQELPQHHSAVRAARGAEEAGVLDPDRLARTGRAEGHRGLCAVPDVPGVRHPGADRQIRQGVRRRHQLGRCQAAAVRAHRQRAFAAARALQRADGRAGKD